MADVKVASSEPNPWEFSRVCLTLDNVLIPEDKLMPTPSAVDGLDIETEMDLRILGCELIQTSGILLKLPQVAMATGQVLFQRFYYCKSFVNHNMETVAMACINLAAKIEEAPRRFRDVINIFHHMKQIRHKRLLIPMSLDEHYVKLKNDVIKAERRLLKELGFCVHVKHPHKLIVMYLQVLDHDRNTQFVQKAWNYMNDSFRTNVFVRFHPECVAAACIFLAARQLQIPLPSKAPAWWTLITNTTLESIHEICGILLKLYQRAKPNPDELEKKVSAIKKAQQEEKAKLRKALGEVGTNTPNALANNSRPSTPSKVSPVNHGHSNGKVVNGVSKSDSRYRDYSRSQSRSPRRHSRHLPKKYRERSRSHSRSRRNERKYKSKKRSRGSYSRSRSRDRSSKKYSRMSRSRSRSRTRHRDSHKHDRDRYRR